MSHYPEQFYEKGLLVDVPDDEPARAQDKALGGKWALEHSEEEIGDMV